MGNYSHREYLRSIKIIRTRNIFLTGSLLLPKNGKPQAILSRLGPRSQRSVEDNSAAIDERPTVGSRLGQGQSERRKPGEQRKNPLKVAANRKPVSRTCGPKATGWLRRAGVIVQGREQPGSRAGAARPMPWLWAPPKGMLGGDNEVRQDIKLRNRSMDLRADALRTGSLVRTAASGIDRALY